MDREKEEVQKINPVFVQFPSLNFPSPQHFVKKTFIATLIEQQNIFQWILISWIATQSRRQRNEIYPPKLFHL